MSLLDQIGRIIGLPGEAVAHALLSAEAKTRDVSLDAKSVVWETSQGETAVATALANVADATGDFVLLSAGPVAVSFRGSQAAADPGYDAFWVQDVQIMVAAAEEVISAKLWIYRRFREPVQLQLKGGWNTIPWRSVLGDAVFVIHKANGATIDSTVQIMARGGIPPEGAALVPASYNEMKAALRLQESRA